jgi:hypothetical protein
MPVSNKEIGSLAASNVMTLCANHHREIRYGGIEVVISPMTFDLVIAGTSVKIPRLAIATAMPESSTRVTVRLDDEASEGIKVPFSVAVSSACSSRAASAASFR